MLARVEVLWPTGGVERCDVADQPGGFSNPRRVGNELNLCCDGRDERSDLQTPGDHPVSGIVSHIDRDHRWAGIYETVHRLKNCELSEA